jgi:hypothetical protein
VTLVVRLIVAAIWATIDRLHRLRDRTRLAVARGRRHSDQPIALPAPVSSTARKSGNSQLDTLDDEQLNRRIEETEAP